MFKIFFGYSPSLQKRWLTSPCPGVQRGVQLLLQRDVDRAEAGDTRNLPHRLQLHVILTGAIITIIISCHIIPSSYHIMSYNVITSILLSNPWSQWTWSLSTSCGSPTSSYTTSRLSRWPNNTFLFFRTSSSWVEVVSLRFNGKRHQNIFGGIGLLFAF